MATATASRRREAVKAERNGAHNVNHRIARLRDHYEAEDWAA